MDGRTRQVDLARIDGQTLSLVLDKVWPDDTGANYEVVLTPAADVRLTPGTASQRTGEWTVWVNGTELAVTVNGRRRRERQDHNARDAGPQRIQAPMPGKVVRVLVQPGEAVQARQPVVVVEAMKMENELRAAREGTVVEVHAREGVSVDAGALLVVIQ